MTMGGTANQPMVGMEVYGSDNEQIGTVAEVRTNAFLVQKGFLFIRDSFLPTQVIAGIQRGHVSLRIAKNAVVRIAREQLPAEGDAWYGTKMTGREHIGRDTGEISIQVVEEKVQVGKREIERDAIHDQELAGAELPGTSTDNDDPRRKGNR